MTMEALEFKVAEDWQKAANESSWRAFIPEFARDSDGKLHMRRKGSSVAYRATSEYDEKNITYECVQCDRDICGAKVAHLIHNSPFSLSGFGKCYYEEVPYCPNCEEKPSYNGLPIDAPFS